MVLIGMAAALVSVSLSMPASAQSFADYPDTKIEYYTVSASKPRALQQQIRERGPGFTDGDNVTARAFYTFAWSLRSDGPRRCKARLTIETKVIFPRHANPDAMPAPMRADWDEFLAQLERHEMRHIQLAHRAMPKLKAALENGHCNDAFRRAAKVEADLDRQQRAFDAGPDGKVKAGLIFR